MPQILSTHLINISLNPRRGTLQTFKKSITQNEESYSTLISNPVILIMLKYHDYDCDYD